MSPGGPIEPTDADVPIGPMAVPGASPSVLPMFGDLFPDSGGKASAVKAPAPSRLNGRVQQLAAPPRVAPRSAESPAVTESTAVRRSLAGLQTSVTESAFPATIISTPKVFPVNHWDPLAAAALVLLAGLAREGFKTWRRRASQIWPV
jgi:hypothetical protein